MITIRQAQLTDLPTLQAIRYHDRPAIHRDRIQAADPQRSQYFVALYDQQIVGFGLLLLERPPGWTDVMENFPVLIDLFVAERYRRRGVGKALITQMEAVAQTQGKNTIFLSVEPNENPQALALYRRLGYLSLQEEPYYNRWQFTDSDGNLHQGEEWLIDMRKVLT